VALRLSDESLPGLPVWRWADNRYLPGERAPGLPSPPEMELPEAGDAPEAMLMARGYLSMGLDGVKRFTGAYMGNKPVVNMDAAIVKAAVDVAHAQRKPVFTHPQNHAGEDNALAGGGPISWRTPSQTKAAILQMSSRA
jgi:hypothetical protein